MKSRRMVMLSFLVLVFVVIPAKSVGANGLVLRLPSSLVTMEVSNANETYFRTLLSGVPPGYDVGNGYYAGWCVDQRFTIVRKIPIVVTLYSTQNPPLFLEDQRWDMVNYILNHKNGTGRPVQEAIWHFVNFMGNYTPTSPAAIGMVNDANLNGPGFTPRIGQVEAVICYPTYGTQITVIEVTLNSPLQGQGDINNDGSINVQDAILLSAASNTRSGDSNWNRKADLNNDGAVNILDAIIMAVNFGKTYP